MKDQNVQYASNIIIDDKVIVEKQELDVQILSAEDEVKKDAKLESLQRVRLKIDSSNRANTRVHVIGFQYLPQEPMKICQQIHSKLIPFKEEFYPLTINRNKFLCNKKLDLEYCYVLNRKTDSRYIGNTLPTPQILLNKTSISSTNFSAEKQSEQFQYLNATDFDDGLQAISQQMQQIQESPRSYGWRDLLYDYAIGCGPNTIDNFSNFIKVPATIFSNLSIGEDGYVEVNNFDASSYQTLQVVALSQNAVVSKIIPLKQIETQKRDMTQQSNLKKDLFYSTFRNIATLKKDAELEIADYRSAEFQIIDSIPKLFATQIELRVAKGYNESDQGGYTFWEQLKSWHQLTLQEKHTWFSKYVSHELNIFLFFKDPAYFDVFVREYI